MNNNIKRLISIAIAVIVGVSLVIQMIAISNLSKQISSLKEELALLRNEIPSSVNVNTTIEERKALFEKIDYKYGTVNFETNTIPYHLKVLPTMITEDIKIYFVLNNNEYEMIKNGDYYETTIHLGLFEQNDSTDIQDYFIVVQNNEKYIQRFDELYTDCLYNYCLAQFICGNTNVSYSESSSKMTINYAIDIRSEINSFLTNYEDIVDIIKVEMITELNDEVIEREDVTSKLNKSSSTVFNSVTRKSYDGSFDHDTVHIYFEITYENGYVQKETLALRSPDNIEKQYVDTIYDADGNLLFEWDWNK